MTDNTYQAKTISMQAELILKLYADMGKLKLIIDEYSKDILHLDHMADRERSRSAKLLKALNLCVEYDCTQTIHDLARKTLKEDGE